MRPMTILLALLGLALTCRAHGLDRAQRLLQTLHDPESHHVMVVAHRGDQHGAPENSLVGFENCIAWGVDILEIDLRRTADGHYVVIHDRTLDRTTTGTGRVDQHSLADIAQLRLRDAQGRPTEHPVPTLEQVLTLARGRVLVYLDKTDDQIDQVHAEVERLGAQDLVLYYGRLPVAELRARYGPLLDRIRYLPKLGDATPEPQQYVQGLLGYRPAAFILDFEKETSPVLTLVPQMRAAGARVWASPLWPNYAGGRTDDAALVDPDANWGWLLGQGVSMICTDRPKELIDYLRRIGRRDASLER